MWHVFFSACSFLFISLLGLLSRFVRSLKMLLLTYLACRITNYFTMKPFASAESLFKSTFLPRAWLYLLPSAGVLVLMTAITAFVAVFGSNKSTEK